MKYCVLIFLGALMVLNATELEQNNEIDVVLNMLADLRNNAQSELDLLNQQWEQNQQRKQTVIQSLAGSVQQQRGECNNRDQDVANKERDITITLSFITWLEKRIKENGARLALLDINRCDSNSNFINDVKNSKMLLNMITFLRNAIRNSNERDLPALLEKAEFQTHFKNYLNNAKSFLQIRNPEDDQSAPEESSDVTEIQADPTFNRDSSEPVTRHIDVQPLPVHAQEEERDLKLLQAEVAAVAQSAAADPRPAHEDGSNPSGNSGQFTQAQQELLNVLDEIEQEIKGKFSRVQDNQVKSAMGYRDFKGLIRKENEAFEEHIVQENENLKKLQNQLITALQVTANCKARLKQISQALEFANEDLSGANENYNGVKERLQNELDLFGDVHRVYSQQVGSQTDSYKQNVQSNIRN